MSDTKSVKVRAPEREEIERVAEIAQIAFQTDDSWVRGYNSLADNHGLEYIVAVEAGGELVASLVCSPGTVYFGSDEVPFSAVGAVATLPEHRRHGYAGMMMEKAVRILHKHGHVTSALWPFSFEYYRKFGWELASENRIYSLSPELASQLASSEGVRPALESDIPAISRLVERFAHRYNGVSLRNDTWWKHNTAVYNFRFDGSEDLKASSSPWVHETGGEIDGYAWFQITQMLDQSVLDIKEIIADNSAARRSILSRFAAAEVSSIYFCVPMDDGFLQELPNPRAAKSEIHAGFQFRVIDPPSALEHRTTDPKLTGALSFTVGDPVLGTHEFSVQVGGGQITKSRSRSTDHLSMSIQTFSQLYSGYMRPTRALELGRLEASSTSAIHFAEQLFPDVLPYRSLMELG